MKVTYHDDCKGKYQSWTAEVQIDILNNMHHSDAIITAYGETKEEAHENLVRAVRQTIYELTPLIP